jgi:PAS domain S-box-containing protein
VIKIRNLDKSFIESQLKDKNLREPEENFRSLFESSSDLYFLVDDKKKILDFEGNEDLLYITPDMFLGRSFKDVLPEEVTQKFDYAVKETYKTKKPTKIEYSLLINDNSHYFEAINFYITNDRIAIHVKDITKQKKTDQNLTAILDHTHILVAYLDAEFNFIRVNRAYAKADDKDESFFPGRNHFDLYPNEENEAIFRNVVETGEPYYAYGKPFEYSEHPERGITYWDWSLNPIKGSTDEVEGLVFTLQNVTDHKIAELNLRKSEEDYRSLIENFEGIAYQGYQDFSAAFFRGAVEDVTGYSEDDFLTGKKKWNDIIHKDDLHELSEKIMEFHKNSDQTHDKREYRIINRNGEIKWILEFCEKFYDPNLEKEGVRGIVVDITEKKLIEQKLRESEKRLKDERDNLLNMLNSMEDGVYIVNQYYEIEFVNPSLEDAFGPVGKKKCYQYFQNLTIPCPWCKTQEKAKQGSIRWEWDSPITKKFYEIVATPIKNVDGNYSKLVIFHDITKRKKATDKLKIARERADMYLNLAGVILVALNRDGLITLMNKKGYQILEYEEGELNGQSWFDICIPTRYKDRVFKVFKQLMRSEIEPVEFFENPIITKNGKEKIIVWHNTLLYDKNGDISGTISSGENITERKKAEKELKRLSKLKSDLLTRTSHELKTPAMHIKGYSDLLLHKYKDNLGIDELQIISHIKKGVLRLETLIYDILHKAELDSAHGELNKTKNDLSSLIDLSVRELNSFAALRGHSIKLNIDDNMIINFDEQQIRHVLNNLITNAIKYTPLNGIIGINSTITDDFITIAVQDNGIGLTEKQINQLFTQFGKIERYGQGFDIITEGSGLGLHIAKKIIDLHGGRIWVESGGINKGSTFYFSLPKVNY